MLEEDDIFFFIGTVYSIAVMMPLIRQPLHTSKLTGEEWTQEILSSENPRLFPKNMRMEKPVFQKLCEVFRERGYLRDSRHVSVEQQLHIFLYIVSNNAANRNVQGRFQHSGETISRYFNIVLTALVKLSEEYITLPNSEIPDEITHNTKFYPYFKDCLGAIDGSLIPASVPASTTAAFRCRKGFLAQNILAVCSFDLTFQYVLAGWEGSANDSKVLEDALTKGFQMPEDRYYLADAGYGLTMHFLTPYRGVRYHLKEFAQSYQW